MTQEDISSYELEWLSFWRFASTDYYALAREPGYSGISVQNGSTYTFKIIAYDFDRYAGLNTDNDPFDMTIKAINTGDVTFYNSDSDTKTFNNRNDINTFSVDATRSSGRLVINFVCDINADIEILEIKVDGNHPPGTYVHGLRTEAI